MRAEKGAQGPRGAVVIANALLPSDSWWKEVFHQEASVADAIGKHCGVYPALPGDALAFAHTFRQVCDGGLRWRCMYLPTLVWPMSMPSLSSSP